MESDETLDCSGLYCPMPIIRTKKRFMDLEVGQVLEVVATDEGIKQDMVAWCESTGNELVGIEDEKDQIRVYVKKING